MGKVHVHSALALIAAAGFAAFAQSDSDAAADSKPSQVQWSSDSLGTIAAGPFSLSNIIPNTAPALLGVEEAWGFYWVTGRNNDGAAGAGVAGAPNKVFKFSKTGQFLAAYPQTNNYDPAFNSATTSIWGGRDLAADEANNKLYYGWEGGYFTEHTYNPVTGDIDAGTTTQIIGLTGTIRALARTREGKFYTADFSGPLRVFTVGGGVEATYLNNFQSSGAAVAMYGMGFNDDQTGAGEKLWTWSQNGPLPANDPNQRVLAVELDISGGIGVQPTRTGREFFGDTLGTPSLTNNIAGGADVYCENGELRMIALHQAPQDTIVAYDLDAVCQSGGGCGCVCNYDTSTGNNVCDIFDFLTFGNLFSAADPCACDLDTSTGLGVCDIFDFLEFGNLFNTGC